VRAGLGCTDRKIRVARSLIERVADEAGLTLLGVTTAEPLSDQTPNLKLWQDRGFAGTMDYMLRDSSLLTEPQRIVPDAKSIAVFAVSYSSAKAPPRGEGYGRVARYAWGRDYHRVLKRRLANFVEEISRILGTEVNYRVFSDAVPLLERALGRRAGLGFIGKNTLLIRPKVGSLFFIAEVIWNLEVAGETLPLIEEDCGPCRKCRDRCPTGAIIEDRLVDAKKCISYLTIEKEGNLGEWERSALGEWIFGCDTCQEVCPFNHTTLKREKLGLPEFEKEIGAGPLLFIPDLLRIRTDAEYLERFAGTPLMRPGREGLLRNAAVVAGNTRAYVAAEALKAAVADDPSALIREHAQWALSHLLNQR
jgi:epoxyqueuosine reductase